VVGWYISSRTVFIPCSLDVDPSSQRLGGDILRQVAKASDTLEAEIYRYNDERGVGASRQFPDGNAAVVTV
jgi:hypothetical protein